MNKKSLFLLILFSLFSGSLFFLYAIIERINHKRSARENLTRIDNFSVFDLDSVRYFPRLNRKSVLVFFDSGCDHCQYEINAIVNNNESLQNSDIILTSSESISTIKIFVAKNYPRRFVNIRFTKINQDHAFKTFGSLLVPQIFIYGTDGVLIKEFKGETKIDAILQYL